MVDETWTVRVDISGLPNDPFVLNDSNLWRINDAKFLITEIAFRAAHHYKSIALPVEANHVLGEN